MEKRKHTQRLESLIKPDTYQVLLVTSPASFPLSFASHPWFVINKRGVLSRWGVGWRPQHYQPQSQWGHIALDACSPFQGLRALNVIRNLFWPCTCLHVFEGDESSGVAKMIEIVENSPNTYPYKDLYSFFGPNSNTYAQWIIDQVPESGMTLPWNSFGKNYNRKRVTIM